MQRFFADYWDVLQRHHAAVERALDGLSQEALDWSPAPEVNSIGALAAHIIGSERYWISDVVAQTSTDRDRDAEFRSAGISAEALRARLAAAARDIRAILEHLTLDQLDETRISPRHGIEYTVGWALAHVLEHTGLHVGHMEMMRHWWEQSQGD